MIPVFANRAFNIDDKFDRSETPLIVSRQFFLSTTSSLYQNSCFEGMYDTFDL